MRKVLIAICLVLFAYLGWVTFAPWHGKLVPPEFVYPDGSRYYGPTEAGLAQGAGEWQGSNGARYVGSFEQGLFAGVGEQWDANGDHYRGSFAAGLRSGLGQLESVSGDHYAGQFDAGLPHGMGHLTLVGGDQYFGQFRQGIMSGQGVYTLASGDIFSGTFAENTIIFGIHKDTHENQYTGTFKHWYYHGKGQYLAANNTLYKGEFEEGSLQGEGEIIAENGEKYSGEIKDWAYHGHGRLVESDGSVYVGEFEYGYYHGNGTQTLAEEVNGIGSVSGVWKYGKLQDDPRQPSADTTAEIAESALYLQNELLGQKLAAVGSQHPDNIDLFYLGIASYGAQDVFRKEIDTVTKLFRQQNYADDRVMTLINNQKTVSDNPLATLTSVEQSIQGIGTKMDRENDILFLYITTHGSDDHELSVQMNGIRLNDLTPERLQSSLQASQIKWKVIVISACYSGGFINALADENTLVLTSAREDRTSFGCGDDSDMTYFGKAYFTQALPNAESFVTAFYAAEKLVSTWEEEDFPDLDRSEPQIHLGKNIEQHLRKWRQQVNASLETE